MNNKFNDIEIVSISHVKPSPENDEIYGEIDPQNDEFIELIRDIKKNGIREPILISADGWILSGHRRFAAAKKASLDEIPIRRLAIRRDNFDSLAWKKELRAHNHQRHKSVAIRQKEMLLGIEPEIAYRQLLKAREEIIDANESQLFEITGRMNRSEISLAKQAFLNAIMAVVLSLRTFWPVSVRQVHYRLLNDPPLRNSKRSDSKYRNDLKSYKDLTNMVTRGRLTGLIPWNSISDETRPVSNLNYCVDRSNFIKHSIFNLFRNYHRDLLQSQADHFEIIVEKMTVQSLVQQVSRKYCIPTTTGRGYCSLDPRKRIADRFSRSGKNRLVLILVSDFDPDGLEIAESFARSLRDDFGIDDVLYIRALLTEEQIERLKLPPNGMKAKKTSSNYKKFVNKYGRNVYELEAVPPETLMTELTQVIESTIDIQALNKEIKLEKQDAAELVGLKKTLCEFLQQKGLANED